MRKNPFGDDPPLAPRSNPFGEEDSATTAAEAANRIENSARKIRNLRTQLGSEGLTLPATRELIDEVAAALEAAARVLRTLS